MKQYHDLCKHILENGISKGDRTGTGTLSTFGYQMRFDLSKRFPLLTTKKTNFRLIAEELLWFLKGETNIKPLVDKNVNIWNGDAYREYVNNGGNGDYDYFVESIKDSNSTGWDLGPVYGKQWRSWTTYKEVWGMSKQGYFIESIDQISQVIESIKNNPDSRRHIVSAWNVADIEKMALPPCHVLFQFWVANGKLYCQLYQRSGDVFLGVPFNIASYSLLTIMIAKQCNLEPGEFIHTLGDAHIYNDHIEQVKLQLTRDFYELPILELSDGVSSIFDYKMEDFKLLNYKSHGKIKGKLSN